MYTRFVVCDIVFLFHSVLAYIYGLKYDSVFKIQFRTHLIFLPRIILKKKKKKKKTKTKKKKQQNKLKSRTVAVFRKVDF